MKTAKFDTTKHDNEQVDFKVTYFDEYNTLIDSEIIKAYRDLPRLTLSEI
jgi:hypothetical protein